MTSKCLQPMSMCNGIEVGGWGRGDGGSGGRGVGPPLYRVCRCPKGAMRVKNRKIASKVGLPTVSTSSGKPPALL